MCVCVCVCVCARVCVVWTGNPVDEVVPDFLPLTSGPLSACVDRRRAGGIAPFPGQGQ